jgi:PhnB protein
MKAFNPYLNFAGNTEEAFNFYKSIFGGEYAMVMRYKDTPEGAKLSAKDAEKIMHIALPIGNGNVLMATDALESMGQKLNAGNNFSLSVHVDSEEDAHRIFNALADGGKVIVPMQMQFWGELFGQLTDKFGIQWMVTYTDRK